MIALKRHKGPNMLQTLADQRTLERIWPIAAILAALAVAIHVAIPLPSDVAWLLTVNERLLAGQHLYVDILETNPPMAAWLYFVPALLGHLTGIRAELFVVLETVAVALLALRLTEAMLEPLRLFPTAIRALAVAVVLLLPVASFAQREHFALFGLLPALGISVLRYAGRTPPRWAVAAAGVGAALAISIKPHEVLVIFMISLLAAWHLRSWRPIFAPEHLLTALLVAAYVGVIAVAYPAFFTVIMPAAEIVYLPIRISLERLLLQPGALFVGAALVAVPLAYRGRVGQTPLPTLLVATIGFALVYVIQGKGWAYHLLPGTMTAMLMLLVPQPRRQGFPSHAVISGVGALIALATLAPIASALLHPDPLVAAVGRFGPGRKIVGIMSDLAIASPLHRELGDTFVDSAPFQWRAAGAIELAAQTTDPVSKAKLLDYADADRQTLAHDLLASPPDLILVQSQPGIFDWMVWARQDPKIAALLDGYRSVDVLPEDGSIVTILKRQ
jgi:hypothetical protein